MLELIAGLLALVAGLFMFLSGMNQHDKAKAALDQAEALLEEVRRRTGVELDVGDAQRARAQKETPWAK